MGTRHSRPRPDRLAEKLRLIRQSVGYTLEEMARALAGVKKSPPSKGHVLRYETGEREPSLLYLLEVSRVFGVSLESLIDDNQELKLPKGVKASKR
jgi:transcriptional regulator with XRE-family HTH domain